MKEILTHRRGNFLSYKKSSAVAVAVAVAGSKMSEINGERREMERNCAALEMQFLWYKNYG